MPTIPFVRQTWTDGVSALSAARLGVIENGIYEVSLAPAVRVTHNANQSITHNTTTALAFNTERFDTAAGVADTQHDTVTNNSRLTCRYAGKYAIFANVEWAANATGVRQVFLRLNGSTLIAKNQVAVNSGTYATTMEVGTLYELAVNDYVEVAVYQDSGAGLNVVSSGNFSPEFMWHRAA